MDYKIAYIEILEKLRNFLDCWRNYPPDNCSYEDVIDDLEYRIPELKESEDERTRKELIELFRAGANNKSHPYKSDDCKRWLSWLEKQGEKNLANAKETCKDEPKFKVGDWLVHRKLVGETFYITQINKPYYYLTNLGSFIKFGEEDDYRLWTIQDAKDGDVLAFNDGHGNNSIELIKSITDKKIEFWFCFTNGNYYEVFDGLIPYTNLVSREDATPATKEQRDLLFQKMKEAGYEWDAEKKELKKVEKKPIEWSEKDEGIVNRIMTALENCESEWCENNNEEKDWLKSLKGRVQPQPKSDWNNNDEISFNRLMAICADANIRKSSVFSVKDIKDLMDWLESIKKRVQPQWKPSDEQMKCLLNAEGVLRADSRIAMAQVLSSLYNDLKALCVK